MPYLGLWQGNHELAAREYARIDLSDTEFTLTNPKNDAVDFVFVNTSQLKFATALSNWGALRIVLFRNATDSVPVVLLDPIEDVRKFDTITIRRGGLRLEQTRTTWALAS
jgi:hypothetical protein